MTIDELIEAINYHETIHGTLEVRTGNSWMAISELISDAQDAGEDSAEVAEALLGVALGYVREHEAREGELGVHTPGGWRKATDMIRETIAAL